MPRSYQRKLWDFLEGGGTRAIEVAHRRWGKDDLCLHWAAIACQQRVGNVWHCLPEFAQARKAIWTAVNSHTGVRRIDEAFPLELRSNTNEQEMFIRFTNGSTWQVIGSDNYSNLVGTGAMGLVFSEWAKADPAAWAYLAPILVENDGWALFITTPQGRNHAFRTYDLAKNDANWFAEKQSILDSGALGESAVEAQRAEYHSIFGQDIGDALIEQEFYCSFEAAILGAVYSREMAMADKEDRITKVDVDPELPIHTAWDLGKGLNMAIWVFQVTPEQVRIVDFIKDFGIGFPSFVAELEKRGYRGGDDWVPHDARVHELGTERSRVESLFELGRKPRLVPHLSIADGINAARQTFPRCYFDAVKCAQGLEALRSYRAEWDDKNKCFRDTQVKDWSSHPADAFRYMSVAWREMTGDIEPKNQIEKMRWLDAKLQKKLSYKPTLDEMLEQYDEERERDE